jgi:hypothetical protein
MEIGVTIKLKVQVFFTILITHKSTKLVEILKMAFSKAMEL